MKISFVFLSILFFIGCSTKQTSSPKIPKSNIDFSILKNVEVIHIKNRTKYFYGPKNLNTRFDWFESGTFLQIYTADKTKIVLSQSKDGENFIPLKAPVWID